MGPAINVFQCASCFRICAELAGVEPEHIEIEVVSDRLWVRGRREAPEPLQQHEYALSIARKPVRVIAMEIDHGQFEREIEIPSGLIRVESRPSGIMDCCGSTCHEKLTPESAYFAASQGV